MCALHKCTDSICFFVDVQILRAEVLYWKVDNPDDFKPEVFPWVIYERGKEHCFVFPEFEYPGMIKVRLVAVNST